MTQKTSNIVELTKTTMLHQRRIAKRVIQLYKDKQLTEIASLLDTVNLESVRDDLEYLLYEDRTTLLSELHRIVDRKRGYPD